jgi:Protein of unknown function (DUF2782)
MNSKVQWALLSVGFSMLFAGAPCRAQSLSTPLPPDAGASAPAAARVDQQPTEAGEPNVTHTVIEDDGSKIDELRIRGQLQHVVVTPKVGFRKPYEIIVNTSGRAPGNGVPGNTGADGKTVWSVLLF